MTSTSLASLEGGETRSVSMLDSHLLSSPILHPTTTRTPSNDGEITVCFDHMVVPIGQSQSPHTMIYWLLSSQAQVPIRALRLNVTPPYPGRVGETGATTSATTLPTPAPSTLPPFPPVSSSPSPTYGSYFLLHRRSSFCFILHTAPVVKPTAPSPLVGIDVPKSTHMVQKQHFTVSTPQMHRAPHIRHE